MLYEGSRKVKEREVDNVLSLYLCCASPGFKCRVCCYVVTQLATGPEVVSVQPLMRVHLPALHPLVDEVQTLSMLSTPEGG